MLSISFKNAHPTRTWTLRILSVREEDQGCYMCQINTAKMMLQVGCIKVLGMKHIIRWHFRNMNSRAYDPNKTTECTEIS